MADFGNFDPTDNVANSDPESFIVTVPVAGSPQTVTPANGRFIQVAFINVPRLGPNAGTNANNDYILYSTDAGNTFHTLRTNESVSLPGIFTDLRIDASKDGMKAEVEIRS